MRIFGLGCLLTLRGDERKVVKFYNSLWQMRRTAHPFLMLGIPMFFLGQAFLIGSIAWKRWNAMYISVGWSLVLWCIAGIVAIVGLAWPLLVFISLRRLEAKRKTLPRLCPSCVYSLVDLPIESDGCTLCPECGSAWKFEAE